MSLEMDVFTAMNLVRVNAPGSASETLPPIVVRTDSAQPTNKQILTELRATQNGLLALAQALDARLPR